VLGAAVRFAYRSATDSGQFSLDCWCFWTQKRSFFPFSGILNQKVFYICRRF